MPEYLRVKTKDTGTEWSVIKSAFDPEAEDEVEGDAVDVAGDPLPPVFGDRADAAPGGNASLTDWQDYARLQGASDGDLEGKSRDDLRSEYATPTPPSK